MGFGKNISDFPALECIQLRKKGFVIFFNSQRPNYVAFIFQGEAVFAFNKVIQDAAGFILVLVWCPACHLANAINACIGIEVFQVRFLPGPEDQAMGGHGHACDVDLLVHICSSF